MKKKMKKLVLGHSLAINDKNCLYLYCFLRQGIYLVHVHLVHECSRCLLNNLVTSCVVLLAFMLNTYSLIYTSCAVDWIPCSGLVKIGFASG